MQREPFQSGQSERTDSDARDDAQVGKSAPKTSTTVSQLFGRSTGRQFINEFVDFRVVRRFIARKRLAKRRSVSLTIAHARPCASDRRDRAEERARCAKIETHICEHARALWATLSPFTTRYLASLASS